MDDTPALVELAASGLEAEVVRYEPAGNAPDAAARRGVPLEALIKTLVVRRGDADFLLVLVTGDRVIDWPLLRDLLGVKRLSLAGTDEAQQATGYARGTITPFGASRRWPVIADERIGDRAVVSIGGGAHGVAIHLKGPDLLDYLGATSAAVTRPA